MDKNETKAYEILDKLNISYKRFNHGPVATIADIEEGLKDLKVIHFKNIFLRNSKGDKHYLLLIDRKKRANTKELAKIIGSTRLSFASDDRLEKYLGIEPGAVSPMGLINDRDKEVEVLVDKDLAQYDEVTLHPNVNTASITISYGSLYKFLSWSGNKIQYIEIPERTD